MPARRRPSAAPTPVPARPGRRAQPAEPGRDASAAVANGAGDIVVRLASMLPSLAPAERRVGKIIVDDPLRSAGLTITDLAHEAGTSETTVVRFCRNVGVGSYPTLRLAVATWAGRAAASGQPRLSPDIDPDDGLGAVAAKIGQSVATAVQETADRLDLDALAAAVDAIASARRIDVYGVGASGFVALDLQQKLHRIGLSVWAWSDPHMAITSAANLTPDDVVVALSHSGTTVDTLDALAEARRRGARAVAVTNFVRSPVAEQADIVLSTVTNETTFRSGAMASRIAALIVVDCLFVAVAQRRYTATTEALMRTSEALATRRLPARRRR
jgi:DNA-binding MurR/RpiR family transcriptional regulator